MKIKFFGPERFVLWQLIKSVLMNRRLSTYLNIQIMRLKLNHNI